MSTAITNRPIPVAVEFDTTKGRQVRTFDDAVDAKKFFVRKTREEKNPTVLAADATPDAAPAKPAKAKPAKPAKPAATEKPAKPAKPRKAKKGGKPRAPKQAADDKPARLTVPGACGQVLHRNGLETAITDEMVQQVGQLLGRDNPRQDVFILRQVQLGIAAYVAATNG